MPWRGYLWADVLSLLATNDLQVFTFLVAADPILDIFGAGGSASIGQKFALAVGSP